MDKKQRGPNARKSRDWATAIADLLLQESGMDLARHLRRRELSRKPPCHSPRRRRADAES